jgi:hypothetical protein
LSLRLDDAFDVQTLFTHVLTNGSEFLPVQALDQGSHARMDLRDEQAATVFRYHAKQDAGLE